MKDLLLIEPPKYQPKHVPLGVTSLYSYLKPKGCSIDVVNLNKFFNTRLSLQPFKNALLDLEPAKKVFSEYKFIGVSWSYMMRQLDYCLFICEWLRKEFPNTKILVGGSAATFISEKAIKLFHLSDYYICGEGEVAVEQILSDVPKEQIVNLATDFTLEGVVVQNQTTMDINELPFLDFSWNQPSKYEISRGTFYSSKGCAWSRCAFCTFSSIKKTPYRRKTKDRIKDELVFIKKQNPDIDTINFFDEYSPTPLLRDCKDIMLSTPELNGVTWRASIRADGKFTEEFVEELSKSRLIEVFVGIESLDQRILDVLDKGITVEDIWSTTFLFMRNHIQVSAMAMYHLPTQTEQEARVDIENLKNLVRITGCNLRMSRYDLIRNQTVFNNPEKYGLCKSDIEEAMEDVGLCFLRDGKPISFKQFFEIDGDKERNFVTKPGI